MGEPREATIRGSKCIQNSGKKLSSSLTARVHCTTGWLHTNACRMARALENLHSRAAARFCSLATGNPLFHSSPLTFPFVQGEEKVEEGVLRMAQHSKGSVWTPQNKGAWFISAVFPMTACPPLSLYYNFFMHFYSNPTKSGCTSYVFQLHDAIYCPTQKPDRFLLWSTKKYGP